MPFPPEKGAFSTHRIFALPIRWAIALLFASASGYGQDTQDFLPVPNLTVSLQGGYRVEDFSWSIAGNLQGQQPTIYSELIWKSRKGPNLTLGLTYAFWKNLLLRVNASHGWVLAGSATDTDYQGDNRTSPVFIAPLKSDEGYQSAIEPGLGYRFRLHKALQLTPYVGYGFHTQKYYLLDSNIPDLRSTYQSWWKGPFGGVDATVACSKRLHLEAAVAYHQVDYHAEADWNLIQEFEHPVSFRHTAKGYGLEATLKVRLQIASPLAAYVFGQYGHWSTGEGIDELYRMDGTRAKTQLNDATRTVSVLGLGMECSF